MQIVAAQLLYNINISVSISVQRPQHPLPPPNSCNIMYLPSSMHHLSLQFRARFATFFVWQLAVRQSPRLLLRVPIASRLAAIPPTRRRQEGQHPALVSAAPSPRRLHFASCKDEQVPAPASSFLS